MAAGDDHALALTCSQVPCNGVSGGTATLYSWGDNSDGQVGNGSYGSPVTTPITVGFASGVTPIAIASGQDHTIALTCSGSCDPLSADGSTSVYTWGLNSYGQLGIGSTSPDECGTSPCSWKPVQVTGFTGTPIAVAAGSNHTLLLTCVTAPCIFPGETRLYVWGDNNDGQLGMGTGNYNASSTPEQVTNLVQNGTNVSDDVIAIGAGGDDTLALAHTYDSGNGNPVFAWGNNSNGQLGNSTTGSNSPVPVQVGNLDGMNPSDFPQTPGS